MSSLRPDGPDGVPVDSDDLGSSTRAIRAASQVRGVLQRPTTVPIYQTATFSSLDSEELATVAADLARAFIIAGVGTEAVAAAVAT